MSTSFCPFVYGLFDPVEPGHIRYVGMTRTRGLRGLRPYQHMAWACKPSTKSSHFKHWILKLRAEGRDYGVVVLEKMSENVSDDLLGFVEKCYIKSLRAIGHKLTNISEGGNGGNLGPAVVEKMAKSKKGKPAKTGYKFTPEQRRNVSLGLKKAGYVAHRQTQETREKMSASKMKHMLSPETLAKRSLGAKAAWARRKAKAEGAQAS